jgi:FkbM family methyltransferase
MFIGIEPDLRNFTERSLKPGETVLDIGANVGLLARPFCKLVRRTGRVLAFEPAPENLQALRFNLRRFPQAEIVELAISDNNESSTFYLNCESGTGNSLVPLGLGFDKMKPQEISVQCQTLDLFLKQRPDVRPDWVKIDVEGGEFRVLHGMQESVCKFPNMRILIEVCLQNLGGIDRAEQLVAEIRAMGFTPHLIRMDGTTEPFRGVSEHPDSFAPHGYVNLFCARDKPPMRNKNLKSN